MAPQPNILKNIGKWFGGNGKQSLDWLFVSPTPGLYCFLEFISNHFSLGENLWKFLVRLTILKNYWVMRILLISSLFDVVLRARKFVNVFCCIITIGENYLRKTLIFPLFFSLFLSLFPLSLPFFLPLPSAWVFDFFPPPQGGGERIC